MSRRINEDFIAFSEFLSGYNLTPYIYTEHCNINASTEDIKVLLEVISSYHLQQLFEIFE